MHRAARWLAALAVAVTVVAALALVPATAEADPVTIAVSGTLTTSQGQVLAGWSVGLYNNVGVLEGGATTDGSGHYAFDVPSGGWQLDLFAPGSSLTNPVYGITDLNIPTESGPVTANLSLPVVTETWHVVDGGGHPVVGATVSMPAYSADDLSSPVVNGSEDRALFAYQPAQVAITDATGTASLTMIGVRHSVWAVGATATVKPPAASGLSGTTIGVIPTKDTDTTIPLSSGAAYTVKGTLGSSTHTGMFSYLVEFESSSGTVLASANTDEFGDYQATVPATATRVAVYDDDPLASMYEQSDGLALTGPRTLNLTSPQVQITVAVRTLGGGEVKNAVVSMPGVGSPGSPAPIDPLFSGGSGGSGWEGPLISGVDEKGQTPLQLLRTAGVSTTVEADPAPSLWLQDGTAAVSPTASQTVTVSLSPIPTIVPGLVSTAAPTSGTVQAEVPVTLSAPSTQTVTAHWTTLVVPGSPAGQAPTTDYTAASGTVTFAPGQTSATVPVAVSGDSLGGTETVAISFTQPTNAFMGGFWGLGFLQIQPAP